MDRFYAYVRMVSRFWLWFFFKDVSVVHAERVPAGGPVLLCINHPNNLIDSLLVGGVLPRKVHYLATAALFRNPLVARFLAACGAIPVYRKQDDPDQDGQERRRLRGLLPRPRGRAARRHLPGGHDPLREPRAADQDRRRPASRSSTRPPARGGPLTADAGRPELRRPQVVPEPRARLLRRADPGGSVRGGAPRGPGPGGGGPDHRDPVGHGGGDPPGGPPRARRTSSAPSSRSTGAT